MPASLLFKKLFIIDLQCLQQKRPAHEGLFLFAARLFHLRMRYFFNLIVHKKHQLTDVIRCEIEL